QFGVLGLWAAAIAGVKVPASSFQRAERWWKGQQGTDGGWGYGSRDLSYGSMTCAGVAAMSICARGLEDPDRNRGQEVAGLRWLGGNFTVKDNPKSGSWHYYYLYSLERAGTITAQKTIGGKDWYQEGARFLVDAQAADGSWTSEDPISDTCFAILFLKRATSSLITGVPQDRASVTPDDPATEPAAPDDPPKDEKK
ncbi:MAG: prenyltransferase/squalene oxidase repeat-containing protein, partial [Planctomycetota bacterium]